MFKPSPRLLRGECFSFHERDLGRPVEFPDRDRRGPAEYPQPRLLGGVGVSISLPVVSAIAVSGVLGVGGVGRGKVLRAPDRKSRQSRAGNSNRVPDLRSAGLAPNVQSPNVFREGAPTLSSLQVEQSIQSRFLVFIRAVTSIASRTSCPRPVTSPALVPVARARELDSLRSSMGFASIILRHAPQEGRTHVSRLCYEYQEPH